MTEEETAQTDGLVYDMQNTEDRFAFMAHMMVRHVIGDNEPEGFEVDGFFGSPDMLSSVLASAMVSEDVGYLMKAIGGGNVASPMDVIRASLMGGEGVHGKTKAYAPNAASHELERKMSRWIAAFGDEIDHISLANGWTMVAMLRYWLNSRRGAEIALSHVPEEAFEGDTLVKTLRDNIAAYGVPAWARAGART